MAKLTSEEIDFIIGLSENKVGCSAFIKYGSDSYMNGLIKGGAAALFGVCIGAFVSGIVEVYATKKKYTHSIK